ncbi:bacillithiol biosynthesis deacetylase BshB1 [Bacillus massilinigeriensis]|uniref:bacillithiol biosynthesis deacetylase BshB1 n=1 Tax=Bacillus mediterraneensis TaxID=1805474 RepID=UPI0008F83632|nr:bacillithiol biosynthesis deacetylase BshB1 [Bacillus mediterraneensis]
MKESIKLDILSFGAHADDVEIGMGGTIAKYAAKGRKIGICDLTEAELSSNGTTELRRKEASHAAGILGVSVRETLGFPDRGLFLKDDYIRKTAHIIRKYKPDIIFAPYSEDRHPDHGNCSRIVEEAFFSAGIKKYETEGGYQPHKASRLFYYIINGYHKPHFVIDASSYIEQKAKALNAYKSQFTKSEGGADTPLVNGYIETVLARERMFGQAAGVMYAEGFLTREPFLVHDLLGDEG